MSSDRTQLRIPGPTPMPDAVRAALSKQMINHRGSEYAAIQREVLDGLRHFFQTAGDVLLFTGSGTGGLEAAIVNTLSPGDRVLAATMGVFGERFASIAEIHGAHVDRLRAPWGTPVHPDAVAAALEEQAPVHAVLLTANETSTGVMNDVPALIEAIRSAQMPAPLILVDAISALGAIDLPMDVLGIDVLVTGSQKAWMVPPGITMLGVSARAWEAHGVARMPRFYWDFEKQRRAQAKNQDAWTPAVTVMYGLQAALGLMREEGRAAIVERHARAARMAQEGLLRLGFTLFAAEGARSVTVTSAEPPDEIDLKALLTYARDERQVVLAGGQDALSGKILRLGHMGWVTEEDIRAALHALEAGLAAQRGATTLPAVVR